jgi:hypothetical protein
MIDFRDSPPEDIGVGSPLGSIISSGEFRLRLDELFPTLIEPQIS